MHVLLRGPGVAAAPRRHRLHLLCGWLVLDGHVGGPSFDNVAGEESLALKPDSWNMTIPYC